MLRLVVEQIRFDGRIKARLQRPHHDCRLAGRVAEVPRLQLPPGHVVAQAVVALAALGRARQSAGRSGSGNGDGRHGYGCRGSFFYGSGRRAERRRTSRARPSAGPDEGLPGLLRIDLAPGLLPVCLGDLTDFHEQRQS